MIERERERLCVNVRERVQHFKFHCAKTEQSWLEEKIRDLLCLWSHTQHNTHKMWGMWHSVCVTLSECAYGLNPRRGKCEQTCVCVLEGFNSSDPGGQQKIPEWFEPPRTSARRHFNLFLPESSEPGIINSSNNPNITQIYSQAWTCNLPSCISNTKLTATTQPDCLRKWDWVGLSAPSLNENSPDLCSLHKTSKYTIKPRIIFITKILAKLTSYIHVIRISYTTEITHNIK